MNSFDNKLLKLRPDTVSFIRKMYNLDKPEDMDRAVDVLDDWLKKQHHLTKRDYPRDFLERSIIFMKGSVERTKSQIDSMCALRTVLTRFFEKYDAKNDFNTMDSVVYCVCLPKLTEDHYRLFVVHFHSEGVTSDHIMEAYRFGVLGCEYIKAHDYCNGFIVVLDYRKISLAQLLAAIDIVATHQLTTILTEGYDLRIKGMHIVTSSNAAKMLIRLLKSLFGSKVGGRIQLHTNIETLYGYVPKDVLPCELGGYEESVAVLSDQWKDVLGTKENIEYMKEMSRAVSNKAYRIKEKLNALDLGVAGTFRSLSVD